MFECAEQLLSQFISFIPNLIGIVLVFEFTGSLLFGKK